jgi:flagellar M-ring protein FliF
MPNSVAQFSDQLKAVVKTMSAVKLITLVLLVIGTVAGILVLVNWSGRPEFVPLYSQLTAEDAAEMVAKLREQKIPYELTHNGTAVQVPRESLYEVRLELASQGLPRGNGLGFEVFDSTKLGTTEFVQNINYQRALQGELSRTINGLAEVESSRVHIVMSPRSLFIEEQEPATASVILKVRSGRWLSNDQVQGVIHLVSSSVPRLNPENVTIVDQNGKLLAGQSGQPTPGKISSDQLDFQQRKEVLLEKRVASMLEKVLGEDKAIVRVSCDLDFVQEEMTQEKYLPENQVVRSEQSSKEMAAQMEPSPVGVPGLAANITPDQPPDVRGAGPNGFEKQDMTRNYEIGKTVSRQIMPVGIIKRLSVAVIVDGSYETTRTGEGEKQIQEIKYIPRTAEEISKLENIVKRAVNFDEARGDMVEVANIAFNVPAHTAEPESGGFGQRLDSLKDYAALFKYLLAGLFVAFTFIFVIRPLTRWLTDTPWEDVELLEHLPRTIAEIEKQYGQKDQYAQIVNQASQMITNKQDDSARLLEQWLKEA